jgi:toxin-antitoxin system PIN domain toxin
MILPDVNVLIYAFRQDSERHAVCKPWLESVAAGDARFGISLLALGAVVRITTNASAFKQASRAEEAFAFCDRLLAEPQCEVVEPGERHWAIFQRLCLKSRVQGPRVTDAWFAALAIEHGCTWITYDRDFARFPDLDSREPAA